MTRGAENGGKKFTRTFLAGLLSFILVMSIFSSAVAAAYLTTTPEDLPPLRDAFSDEVVIVDEPNTTRNLSDTAIVEEAQPQITGEDNPAGSKGVTIDPTNSEIKVLSFSLNQMIEYSYYTEYFSISGGNPHIVEANLSGDDVVLWDYGESVCENLSYNWQKKTYGYWDEVINYHCVEGQLPYDVKPYTTRLTVTFSRAENASEYNWCTIFLEYINVTVRFSSGEIGGGYQAKGAGSIGSWSGNTFTASWDEPDYKKGNLTVTLSQKPGPKPIVLKASKDGYASVKKEIDNAENYAQIDLSGVAFDEKTGELLEGAKIEILEGANPAATTTDLHGNYSLTAIVPDGSGSDMREDVHFELPPAEYIVGVYEITFEVLDLIEDNNGTMIDQTINEDWPQALLVKISNETDIEPFIDNVNKSDLVQYVERNFIIHALYVPNDERYPEQWGPQSISAGGLPDPSAWDYEKGVRSVRIAIIDSGIQYDHPDLHRFEDGAVKYVYGYDWIDMDNDPYPVVNGEDHGTHCTGIATAVMDNTEGIAGIAPNCSLIAERIFGMNFNPVSVQWEYVGAPWILGFAIMDAADHDADVISMSLGGPLPADVLEEFFARFACQYASDLGCVLVAASGNGADVPGYAGGINFPAGYPTVIAVGATDRNNVRADFSQWGPELELIAPGVDILSTSFTDNYEFMSGTSMATPHVAGVAALMKSRAELWPEEPFVANPKYHLNNNQIREVLNQTSIDLGPPGRDQEYGHGKVDAVHAALCVNLSGTVREALNNASISHPPLVPAPPRVNVTSIEGPSGNYSTFEDTHLARLTEEGDYFVRLPPGVYSVCAMAYGYYPSRGAKGDRVDLPAFDQTGLLTHEELNFTLEPFRCNITGIVIDNETGLPIENANVSLDGPPLLIPPYSNVNLVTKTDYNGAYNFSWDYSVHPPYPIGEAVYDLNVSKPKYYSQTKNFTLNWSTVLTDYYKCPLDPNDYHPPIIDFSLNPIPKPPIFLPDLTLTGKDILFIPPSSNFTSSSELPAMSVGRTDRELIVAETVHDGSKENMYSAIEVMGASTAINSSWTTSPPLIDGNLESDEWGNATKINITYPAEGNCSMFVMNDEENLYIAFDVATDTTLDVNRQDVVQLGFDGDHDNLTAPYNTDPFYEGGTGVDLWAKLRGNSTESRAGWLNMNEAGTACSLWYHLSDPTGPQVLATGFSNHRTYEYTVPLAIALNVAAGDTIGFNVLINDGLGTPEPDDFTTQGLWPSTWNGVCDFTADGDLILATAPNLASLKATTHNSGTADASDIVVQFFDGDPDTGGLQIGGDQTIATIPAGGTRSAQVSWDITDKVGTHVTYVRIDPYNTTAELNESNNLASRQIGIPGVRCSDLNVTIDQAKTSVTDDPVGDGYDLSDPPANVNSLNVKGFNITATGPNGTYPFNITFSSPVIEGFVLFKLPEWTEIPYTILDAYTIQVQLEISNGVLDPAFVLASVATFDTGPGGYPSISGEHNGTITPNQTLSVSKLYTYPCPGTGGHTEYVRIYNLSGTIAEASWSGYVGDWHNISFPVTFILRANETYNYTIKTGSYPQIIQEPCYNATGGIITCTEFVDANGKRYNNWIPAIRLC